MGPPQRSRGAAEKGPWLGQHRRQCSISLYPPGVALVRVPGRGCWHCQLQAAAPWGGYLLALGLALLVSLVLQVL